MEMNPKMQKEVVLYFFPGSCVEIKNHAVFGVRAPVVDIFTEAEACFREYVKTSTKKINAQFIVLSLMKNCSVLTNLKKLRNSASDNIKKEVAVNFLEDLLMLYIRVRTFSYVKNLKECHKIKFDKKRSSSKARLHGKYF